jgi:RHS repeat-associated protein
VLERYIYDPYGKVTYYDAGWTAASSTSAYGFAYLHQGGRYDTVSGLYQFRNRELSPTLGRWMQQDPMRYEGGDSNLYRAVSGNPVRFVDPSGLISEETYIKLACATKCFHAKRSDALAAHAAGMAAAAVLDKNSREHRALRHCVASGYLAVLVGCQCANCVGTARENYQTNHTGQSEEDRNMGVNNNRNGLRVAGCVEYPGDFYNPKGPVGSCRLTKTLDDITRDCKKMLEDGKLDMSGSKIVSID